MSYSEASSSKSNKEGRVKRNIEDHDKQGGAKRMRLLEPLHSEQVSDSDITDVVEELSIEEMHNVYEKLQIKPKVVQKFEQKAGIRGPNAQAKSVLRDHWRQREGKKATRKAILRAIEQCELADSMEVLQKKWKIQDPSQFEQGLLSDLGDYIEVEPDGGGSYASVHVKAAVPTPEQLNEEENYYMSSPVKGLAYILNNGRFPGRETGGKLRKGSDVDFTNMKHLFKELGYKIIPHENLESQNIRESITQFVSIFNEVEADYSSVVVVLMSHGDTGYILGTDEKDVHLKDIQAEFEGNKCPKLQGKPKLFFIQSCRGKLVTTSSTATDIACDSTAAPPSRTETMEVDVVANANFAKHLPDNTDMHFAYATTEGYLSLRNVVNGSWFIQVITEVFFKHAHEDSLDKLMNRVTNRVSGLKGELFDPQTGQKVKAKQTPERVTRMRKTFYFLPKYPLMY